jgi:hypothetical protein
MSDYYEAHRERVLQLNPIAELDLIIQLAQRGKAALADEHEGGLREAVHALVWRAEQLQELVQSW